MGYLERIESREGSLLSVILGLYEVQLPWFNDGKKQCFIVQENLFVGGANVGRKFDLKGSVDGRTAGPTASVQKDNDWTEAGFTMDLAPAVREKVKPQHPNDCDFLAACGVIDYSLLVGIATPPKEDDKKVIKSRHREAGSIGDKNPGIATMMLGQLHKDAPKTNTKSKATSRALEIWKRVREEVMDGAHVFMGLIDFLIPWNMKKRFEFLYKSLKGNR